MTRVLQIVGAAFVVALALAAPRSTITAAVRSTSSELAGADYACVQGLQISADLQQSLVFQPGTGVSFGSAISTTGSTFNSIVLQPGIYRIHLSGELSGNTPQIIGLLNGVTANFLWDTFVPSRTGSGAQEVIVGGDRLVSVAASNTILKFNPSLLIQYTGPCELVITKLQ